MSLDSRMKAAVGLSAAAIALVVALHLIQPFGDNFYVYGDVKVSLFAVLASVAGFHAFKFYGGKTANGRILLLLAIGVSLWSVGELSWAYQEIVLGIEVPLSSVSDVFWLLGYPFFIVGFHRLLKFGGGLRIDRKQVAFLCILLVFAGLSAYGFYPNLVSEELSALDKSVVFGYVVLDFVLIALAMGAAFSFWGGKIFNSWVVVLLAVLAFTAADILYSFLAEQYETGGLFDVLWDASYVLLALGFYLNRRIFEREQGFHAPIQSRRTSRSPPRKGRRAAGTRSA